MEVVWRSSLYWSISSLELNIHQRILSDIASNIGETEEDILYSQNLIASKVNTRASDVDDPERAEDRALKESSEVQPPRVFMVCQRNLTMILSWSQFTEHPQSASRIHCNIAFGELVVNFPESHINNAIGTLMPALMDILKDVPFIDFDTCISWHGGFLQL